MDVDKAIASALDGRYDLSLARQELENADTNIAFFNNQKLPDVRLEASYRGGGFGGTQLLRTGPFPGTVTGDAEHRLRQRARPALQPRLSDVERRRQRELSGRAERGKGAARAGASATSADRSEHREPEASIVQAVRQAGRQVQSTAERVDAARASQGLAEQRVTVETRRFEAGLSTTFLVTQAQRDLVQAQVDLLQAMLDHQSAVIAYEAVQLAAAPGAGDVGLSNANVVVMSPATPQGIFRQGGGGE